jgi:chitin disaccharide deacetylase
MLYGNTFLRCQAWPGQAHPVHWHVSDPTPEGMSAPRLLLVTADDLGYSDERDDGLLRAHHEGLVRNASLLVNGASAKRALQRACDAGLCVGLHLNLTEGVPCGAPESVRSLLRGGFFRGKFGLRDAIISGDVQAADVAAEFSAQLARFRALHPRNAGPAYLDGHQHVHVLPLVVSAICSLVADAAIPAVRIPSLSPAEDLTELAPARRAFYAGIDADCAAARSAFSRAGAAAPPAFFGYSARGGVGGVERVLGVLRRFEEAARAPLLSSVPAPCAEWMTHPGLITSALRPPGPGGGAGCGNGPDDFSMSVEREEELAVLCDPKLRDGVAALGWRPASYDDFLQAFKFAEEAGRGPGPRESAMPAALHARPG